MPDLPFQIGLIALHGEQIITLLPQNLFAQITLTIGGIANDDAAFQHDRF